MIVGVLRVVPHVRDSALGEIRRRTPIEPTEGWHTLLLMLATVASSAGSVIAAARWDEWVALGTLTLAGVTLVLAVVSAIGVWVAVSTARETKKLVQTAEQEMLAVSAQAEASQRQADVARAALEASVQPMLGPVPVAEFDDADPEADRGEVRWRLSDDYVLISVPLRNVGAGVALVTGARITDRGKKMYVHGDISHTAIPVGETTRIFFALQVPEHNDIVRSDAQLVSVRYADVSGTQKFVSVAAVREVSHHDPQVVRVGVYEHDEEEPFVTIGPLPASW